jgi:hypothetical protein
MTNPTAVASNLSVVCSCEEGTVTLVQIEKICTFCRIGFAKRKYCSSPCRQAGYRLSPAHAKNAAKQKVVRLQTRNDWVAAKIRDKSFGFDGRFGGHENKSVPCLGEFKKLRRYDSDLQTIRTINDEIAASGFSLGKRIVNKDGVTSFRLREDMFHSTIARIDAAHLDEVMRRVTQGDDVVGVVLDKKS